jgi:hypothetical protein
VIDDAAAAARKRRRTRAAHGDERALAIIPRLSSTCLAGASKLVLVRAAGLPSRGALCARTSAKLAQFAPVRTSSMTRFAGKPTLRQPAHQLQRGDASRSLSALVAVPMPCGPGGISGRRGPEPLATCHQQAASVTDPRCKNRSWMLPWRTPFSFSSFPQQPVSFKINCKYFKTDVLLFC